MNENSDAEQDREQSQQDENRYIAQRREKLAQLREQGQAYPNRFKRKDFAGDLHKNFGDLSREELEQQSIEVRLAGRMMFKRVMGKASFGKLRDRSGACQSPSVSAVPAERRSCGVVTVGRIDAQRPHTDVLEVVDQVVVAGPADLCHLVVAQSGPQPV